MLLRGDVGRTSEYDGPFIFDDALKEECRWKCPWSRASDPQRILTGSDVSPPASDPLFHCVSIPASWLGLQWPRPELTSCFCQDTFRNVDHWINICKKKTCFLFYIDEKLLSWLMTLWNLSYAANIIPFYFFMCVGCVIKRFLPCGK